MGIAFGILVVLVVLWFGAYAEKGDTKENFGRKFNNLSEGLRYLIVYCFWCLVVLAIGMTIWWWVFNGCPGWQQIQQMWQDAMKPNPGRL